MNISVSITLVVALTDAVNRPLIQDEKMGLFGKLFQSKNQGQHLHEPYFVIQDDLKVSSKQYGKTICNWSLQAASSSTGSVLDLVSAGQNELGIHIKSNPSFLTLLLTAAGISVYRSYPIFSIGIQKQESDIISAAVQEWIDNDLKLDGNPLKDDVRKWIHFCIQGASIRFLKDLMSDATLNFHPMHQTTGFLCEITLETYQKPSDSESHVAIAHSALEHMFGLQLQTTHEAIQRNLNLKYFGPTSPIGT
jgi:hypothetical protein